MQVAIDFPNEFVLFQGEQEIRRDLQLSYALWLLKAERVTLSKAAELAGINIYDFMAACKENQIPVIDVAKEELLAEIGE